jgi:hypothetical protein
VEGQNGEYRITQLSVHESQFTTTVRSLK